MFSKKFLSGAALTALTISLGGVAHAQDTAAAIRGSVTSEAGAGISGAEVTITHTPTGTINTVRTNESGGFFSSGLRVGGPYTVAIDAPGFDVGEVVDIYLDAGEVEPLRVSLYEATELVVMGVRSTPSLNNGAGSGYTSTDISNQPSTTRDVIRTLMRDPLAQSTGTGNLSVAGVNPRFNGLSIDGSLQKDDLGTGSNTYATTRSPINLDAVEAVSLVASDYSVTASGFTGGLINIVTKSGTNELNGSAFYYHADEHLRGSEGYEDQRIANPDFDEREWGVTLGGPIIRDRLFYFLSYDEFESGSGVDFSGNDAIEGYSPEFFSALNELVLDEYGYDLGGRPQAAALPETSERLLAKLDWNITDDHRASFTYQSAEETGMSVNPATGSGGVGRSFTTAWYDIPVELTAYTGQLFSDWTPNLSTAFRANYKEFSRGQICSAGADQPGLEFNFTAADLVGTPLEGLLTNSAERLFVGGCDRSRHANVYNDSRLQLFGSADYTIGNHILTFGGEYQDFELYNLFVERTNGNFVFDNVQDVINHIADITYRNDVSNDKTSAASAWGYQTLAAFVQDSWQINPDFTVDLGVRYERFSTDDQTPPDAAVEAAYGFDPVNSLDGLDLIMPRVSFRWEPRSDTLVTGGFGLFAGGNPNVWFSNAYQPPVVAPGALNNEPLTEAGGWFDVPQSLLDAVANGTPRVIDVIDPDFEIPSDWKASLRVEQEFDLDFGGLNLGDGYLATAQVLYTRSNNGFLWRNLAQTELAATQPAGVAPDGRPIYANLQTLSIPNLTALTNGDGGESVVFSVSLANRFDNGLDFNIGYAHQDIEAISEGGSSRGISSWVNMTTDDRNYPDARTSLYQVEDSFRLSLGYEREFFQDLISRVDLFGQFDSGTPFTYTFNSNSALFGGPGANETASPGNPVFIPDGPSDPRVVYASGFDQGAFFDYVDSHGIPRGRIHEVNSDESTWNQRWDFRFQQELPGLWGAERFVGRNRLKFVLDVQNFLNLLNPEWGTNYNGPSFSQRPIVGADLIRASDASNPNAAGIGLTGDQARTICTTEDACVYRYNTFTNGETSPQSTGSSVYRIRIGLRYEF